MFNWSDNIMTKGMPVATITECATQAEVKSAIDGITLAGANVGTTAGDNYDRIEIVPITGRTGWLVIKVAFAAS